jgi:hypothetical protein
MNRTFAPLPDDFEPTRATLHQYSHAVAVVPRAHAGPHDKWWHISLTVTERGLETDPMELPDGGTFNVRMDLRTHEVVLEAEGADVARISMAQGLTGTEMGDAILAAVASLGLEAQYAREKFESNEARSYDMETAEAFHQIITHMAAVFTIHSESLGERVGPLQLWPHGFDMSLEWFGTRVEEYEEEGEVRQHPSQCNFGFYPGGRAYLYANPWPFEGDKLLDIELPGGAAWHTEGWEGSILYYDQVVGDPNAENRILDYLRAVYEAAAPTLTA